MGAHRKPPPRLTTATRRAAGRHGREYTCLDRIIDQTPSTYTPRHAKPKETTNEQR